MITPERLRALADLQGPERAFLSVYLASDADRAQIESRLGQIRALLADHPDELEQFESNWTRAQELLDETPIPEDGTLAVFTGWAVDLAHAEPVPVAMDTLIWVGDAPYVRPLYEALDENETYAVAVVDNSAARLFLVSPDDAELERRVSGGVKNRVKVGGWSQKRYARRRDKELSQYAQTVADALRAAHEETPFSRLVLLGAAEAMQAVREALPADLAERLVAESTISSDATEAEALAEAATLADEGERADERELWDEIREQGLGGALGALGATAVTEAVHQGRAAALLIDREADIAGTKCRACETVVHGTPDTCQACGSSDVFRLDLVEHLVEQAAQTGADVDFADPIEALRQNGGVGALLRY